MLKEPGAEDEGRHNLSSQTRLIRGAGTAERLAGGKRWAGRRLEVISDSIDLESSFLITSALVQSR